MSAKATAQFINSLQKLLAAPTSDHTHPERSHR